MTLGMMAIAAVTRLYPFLSGTGRIANSNSFKRLGGGEVGDLWARVGAARILVPLNDYVGRSAFFFGDLDPKVTALARHCLNPGDCALDIGANLGIVATLMAQYVGPTGRVHAFEPAPRMIGYLRQTLAANPHLPLRLHEYALGSESAMLELAIPRGNAGRASLVARPKWVKTLVQVPVKTLTDVAREENIRRVDFIKIDVEGFEAEVIKGGLGLIEELRPKFILFEEHRFRPDQPLPESMACLLDRGYRLFGIAKSLLRLRLVEVTGRSPLKSFDYIAVSPDGMPKIQRFIRG